MALMRVEPKMQAQPVEIEQPSFFEPFPANPAKQPMPELPDMSFLKIPKPSPAPITQIPERGRKIQFSIPSIPKFNFPTIPTFRTGMAIITALLGLAMIWFGLTSTGSYYSSATRFGGELANIFYGWQIGTLAAMVGVVLIYHAVRKTANL